MKKLPVVAALTVTSLAAQSAFAHPGHDVASGAIAGLMHPWTGVDHLIAFIGIGALLGLATVRVRVCGVATLLAALAIGAGLALARVVLPASEWMIALSVLVAGLMLVKSGGTQPALLIGGAAVFALFHGYAHGTEITGDAAAFVAAFLASSAAIVALSMFASRIFIERQIARITLGAGTSMAGLALLSAHLL